MQSLHHASYLQMSFLTAYCFINLVLGLYN